MPTRYRRPILIAAFLHVLLCCVLIFSFAPSTFRMPASGAPMPTIHATAISQTAVQAEVQAVSQQQQAQVQQQKEAIEKQQAIVKQAQIKKQKEAQEKVVAEKMAEKKALLLEQEKLAQQKAAKEAKIKEKKQALLEKKAAEAKKIKLEKAAKEKALTLEQKKLQQQLLQQQMMAEAKSISASEAQAKAAAQARAKAAAQAQAQAQAQAAAQQGEIDKYKAEILSAIQSNWRIDQVNSKLKCVYSVMLAPDGTVLSVRLVQSSGDAGLDASAQQAITLSSPLPVPNDPKLFNHFRQLQLTLSPQGFLQSVSSS